MIKFSASILGSSWVTPFGDDLESSWTSVRLGKEPPIVQVKEASKAMWKIPVPANCGAEWCRHPRLRRSSSISLFAVQAGNLALQQAGYDATSLAKKRFGLIFAISSGGVIYTRKFYEQIVSQGANQASPMLFPETVYNAPASHMANLMNVAGITYTLVGDGTVGVSAVRCAQALLMTGELDLALVVASEEVDWVLCEAYGVWRFLSRKPKIELYKSSGTILAEGAAALLLGPAAEGQIKINAHPGVTFYRQKEVSGAVAQVAAELNHHIKPSAAISSANGTFIDQAEERALAGCVEEVHTPKLSLGEALGAGALQQIVYGVELMKREQHETLLVLSTGFNQQATGAVIGIK